MTANFPIPIPASNDLEASRKAAALAIIAASLNVDSLGIIAKAAKKPGADAKLKNFQSYL